MSVITYTAKRSIMSGHSASTSYDIEVGMAAIDSSRPVKKKENVSLSGVTETILHRIDEVYVVESDIIEQSSQDQWLEFGDSVAAGETFTFSPYGDTAPTATYATSTAFSLSDVVEPITSNGYVYECTTAGTTGGTEPTWPTTIGDTVADGTAVWTCKDEYNGVPVILEGEVQDVRVGQTRKKRYRFKMREV